MIERPPGQGKVGQKKVPRTLTAMPLVKSGRIGPVTLKFGIRQQLKLAQ